MDVNAQLLMLEQRRQLNKVMGMNMAQIELQIAKKMLYTTISLQRR